MAVIMSSVRVMSQRYKQFCQKSKKFDKFVYFTYSTLFQLLQGAAELVGAGGAFAAAVYAVKAGYYVINLLAGYQAADALQVAVASAQECYLLDYVVVIGYYVYE